MRLHHLKLYDPPSPAKRAWWQLPAAEESCLSVCPAPARPGADAGVLVQPRTTVRIESFRLEKPFKITEFNCKPNAAKSTAEPCP